MTVDLIDAQTKFDAEQNQLRKNTLIEPEPKKEYFSQYKKWKILQLNNNVDWSKTPGHGTFSQGRDGQSNAAGPIQPAGSDVPTAVDTTQLYQTEERCSSAQGKIFFITS